MNVIWGVVLILFTLILCWMGQLTAALAPALAPDGVAGVPGAGP